MISPHTCTCSTTSPAPDGNSTCGSTVHLLGGPAIRQAGEVYRNIPLWCNSRGQILTSRSPQPSRLAQVSIACVNTALNSHQSQIDTREWPTCCSRTTYPADQ